MHGASHVNCLCCWCFVCAFLCCCRPWARCWTASPSELKTCRVFGSAKWLIFMADCWLFVTTPVLQSQPGVQAAGGGGDVATSATAWHIPGCLCAFVTDSTLFSLSSCMQCPNSCTLTAAFDLGGLLLCNLGQDDPRRSPKLKSACCRLPCELFTRCDQVTAHTIGKLPCVTEES